MGETKLLTAEEDRELEATTGRWADSMLTRLRHGGRKFGALSWRQEPYTDADNEARLRRAVDHLTMLAHDAARDPGCYSADELLKRAADVANQAFMLADPERRRDGALAAQDPD